MGLSGLEPPTSRLSGVRSSLLSYKPILAFGVSRVPLTPFGGDEENRTPDPLLARQVLSQLSYTPIWVSYSFVILPAVALALITHYALRIPNCFEVNPQN